MIWYVCFRCIYAYRTNCVRYSNWNCVNYPYEMASMTFIIYWNATNLILARLHHHNCTGKSTYTHITLHAQIFSLSIERLIVILFNIQRHFIGLQWLKRCGINRYMCIKRLNFLLYLIEMVDLVFFSQFHETFDHFTRIKSVIRHEIQISVKAVDWRLDNQPKAAVI